MNPPSRMSVLRNQLRPVFLFPFYRASGIRYLSRKKKEPSSWLGEDPFRTGLWGSHKIADAILRGLGLDVFKPY